MKVRLPGIRIRDLFLRYPQLDGLRLGILSGVSAAGSRFFDSSYRVTKLIAPGARAYLESGSARRPVIYAVFHGRMVGLLGLPGRQNTTILISRSRDGEIIARAVQKLGFAVARGSPSHGAVQAARELVRSAADGASLVFMVDGPRGPALGVKPAIIRLAEMTGLPVIPFVCHARSKWWFATWDTFMGPLWSSPIVYVFGDPLHVKTGASDSEKEELRGRLEASMLEAKSIAESFFDGR